MSNPFDDPEFSRSYDYYVTVEQPASYHDGWSDGFEGKPFDDSDTLSEQTYREGYEQGKEAKND